MLNGFYAIGSLQFSFPNNFHKHTLATVAVEFAVENLFPWTEIQFAFRNGHHHFTSHDLAFQVGVGIVLASAVVMVLRRGRVRREFFQPDFVVVQQAVLGVVDENGGGDVHGVHETQPLLHVAFVDERGDSIGDVHKAAPRRHFKPELFGERFHAGDMPQVKRLRKPDDVG
jgi:hypothetical protein